MWCVGYGAAVERLGRTELETDPVDAVAEPRGTWTIVEDMTLMASAAGAVNLGAAHAKAAVFAFNDIRGNGGLSKAWPTRA